jgi:hypothetical protein
VSRVILRYSGTGPVPPSDLDRIRTLPGVRMVDDSARRMLLVELAEGSLETVKARLPAWLVVPEVVVPLPDTRHRVLRPKLKKANGRR